MTRFCRTKIYPSLNPDFDYLGWRRWSMNLMEEMANPSSLGNDVSHNTILSLGAGARDRVLPL
jgi:hypothetical protein